MNFFLLQVKKKIDATEKYQKIPGWVNAIFMQKNKKQNQGKKTKKNRLVTEK